MCFSLRVTKYNLPVTIRKMAASTMLYVMFCKLFYTFNKSVTVLRGQKRHNNAVIKEKMAKTFAYRRQEVVRDKPMIAEFKTRWLSDTNNICKYTPYEYNISLLLISGAL